jgi:hypothetical protein
MTAGKHNLFILPANPLSHSHRHSLCHVTVYDTGKLVNETNTLSLTDTHSDFSPEFLAVG